MNNCKILASFVTGIAEDDSTIHKTKKMTYCTFRNSIVRIDSK